MIEHVPTAADRAQYGALTLEWCASPLEQDFRWIQAKLVSHLPVVNHPRQDPIGSDEWTELLSDEICFIVESDDAINPDWK